LLRNRNDREREGKGEAQELLHLLSFFAVLSCTAGLRWRSYAGRDELNMNGRATLESSQLSRFPEDPECESQRGCRRPFSCPRPAPRRRRRRKTPRPTFTS